MGLAAADRRLLATKAIDPRCLPEAVALKLGFTFCVCTP
jgi:hypothetical protein